MPPSFLALIPTVLISFMLCLWAGLRLRQKDRQFLGSFSLFVFLAIWGATFSISTFFAGSGSPPPPLLALLYGLFFIGGSLMSMVLGIVALVLWRGRPGHVIRGKGSAIFSIAANTLILFLIVGVAVFRIVSASGGGIGVADADGTRQTAGDSDSGGDRIELTQYNFSVAPGKSWMRLPDPEKLNPVACLAMRIGRPEIWAMAIVEETGDIDAGYYETIILTNFRSAGLSESGATEDVAMNGMDFRRILMDGSIHNMGRELPLKYECWLSVHEGRAYQFNFWTPASNLGLERAARGFMEGFRTLGLPLASLANVDLPEWGVRTSLAPERWAEWQNWEQEVPHSCFRATKAFCAVQVVPVRWDDEVPDEDAVKAGLLGLMDFNYPADVEGQKPWTDPATGVTGFDYVARRSVDNEKFNYQLRIASHGRNSWLVAAWSAGDPELHAETLKQAIGAIQLRPPEGETREGRPRAAGLVMNGAGLHYYVRGDFRQAEKMFRCAISHIPDDAHIYGNLIDSLTQTGEPDEALALFEKLPEPLVGNVYLEQLHASLLATAERPLEADVLFRNLHEKNSLDDDGAFRWVNSLLMADENERALEAARTYADARPSTKSRYWLAEALEASGDEEGAIEVMGELVEANPHQHELRLDLADMFNRASRPAEAEELALKLIEGGRDSLRARMAIGYSNMQRRWYRQAKEAFEEAVKLAPQNDDAKQALADASALLGQGTNSSIKEPIEPVALPSQLEARLSGITPAEVSGEHAARYVRHLTGWHFVPKETFRRTSRLVIEILDSSGVTRFSSLQFSFDPTFERIHANRLEVFDAEGRKVATGSVDDFYVLDTPGTMADDGKTLHLPVPGLAVGHRIEVEVTREYLRAPSEVPFERHMFGGGLPILAEAVYVTGDPSSVRSQVSLADRVEEISAEGVRAWLMTNQVPAPSEPGVPDLETRHPVVRLGGSDATWKDAGMAYLSQIEEQLKPQPEALANIVSEIAPADAESQVRAAALARYVQRSMNYHAVEFGVRGRIPRSAAETHNRKQGDCKDHAVLLHQMLSLAGIPSQLVLVHTSWAVREDMPTLDQFNHMIVRIPGLSPCEYVDPTSKAAKAGELLPWGLWGKFALILDGEETRLAKLPPKPADCASLDISRIIVVEEGEGLSVSEKIVFGGYYGQWIRGYFMDHEKAAYLPRLQGLFSSRGSYQIESVEFPAADDPESEAVLEIRYRMGTGPGGELTLPAYWETDYLELAFIRERKLPFEWMLPTRIASHSVVTAPKEFSATYLEGLQGGSDSEFCRWKVEAATDGENGFDVRYSFQAEARVWPADRYGSLRDAWRASLAGPQRRIEFAD